MSSTILKKDRNYGVDFLRIASMFMVLILHILGGGGVLDVVAPFSANFCISWFFEIASCCAVNCYALISGYVGLKSKPRYSNIVMMWLQVAFYSIGISAILFFAGKCDLNDVIKSFLPVTFSKYWYFTAYFLMWFFIPVMNAAVEHISESQLKMILIVTGILMFPVSGLTDAFGIKSGYGVIWLSYLYLAGAYIRKSECFKDKSSKKYIFVYLGCISFTFISKVLLVAFDRQEGVFMTYYSPTTVLSAIALLAFFLNVKFSKTLIKIISFVSPLAFGVYLIHMHPTLFEISMMGKFLFLADDSPIIMLISIIGYAIVIFIACILVEYIRKLLFDLLRVKKILVFLEEKCSGFLTEKISKKA
jgi:surface polysaccharide O-acyltransferase-like enzyme